MHYKTKVILSGVTVVLLMMISFVLGVASMNPYVMLYIYEYMAILIFLTVAPAIIGVITSIWQHRFTPFLISIPLAITIPVFVFCSIIICQMAYYYLSLNLA
ncbi:MAG: hypothetical protein A3C61_00165 [Candidatus Yanofskybacteria bacterium RIFCSPHIGHO2_02_FULL_39_10]|uniref:Uncharacterized protein n=1 Tax=Candidatus Yanofskybacteria bacterium RIFCSPHIGHO2_02_FULL_39_10 TaxID=1802674 RepID=A0A1F8F3W6_9BACT|nr:MAG: hypothetical protein A3C61_00165 [Candidatus Yanofskybacteria bacterium RIFCSPHIGHO2_02_FULL_39_10]